MERVIVVEPKEVRRYAKIISILQLVGIEKYEGLLGFNEEELDKTLEIYALNSNFEFILFNSCKVGDYSFVVKEDKGNPVESLREQAVGI